MIQGVVNIPSFIYLLAYGQEDFGATDSHHSGPHILGISPEEVFSIDLWSHSIPISSTIITTWFFMGGMVLLCLWFLYGWFRQRGLAFMTGFLVVRTLYTFFNDIIERAKFTQRVLFILGGVFMYIVLANIFSLVVDWFLIFYPDGHAFLRPINSDINTTLALAIVIILFSHLVMMVYRGFFGYLGSYIFHFSGKSIVDRFVNVFIGWLHLIGEGIRVLSLSMRLFGNIFGGATLIGVITFLTGMIAIGHLPIGQILMIPFWIFELFVACIQAFIFSTLAGVYFREATEHH